MKKRLSLIMVMALVLSVLPICSFAAGNDPYFAGRGTKDDPFLIQTPKDLATLVYLTNDYGLTDDNGNLYYSKADYQVPGTEVTVPSASQGKLAYYCGRYFNVTCDFNMLRYYKLTADLDMSGYDFNKGGICGGINSDANTAFLGQFDGDGHIIKNWKSTSSGGSAVNGIFTWASFGNVDEQGIKNVRVENASIVSDGSSCGVLIGWFHALTGKTNNEIANCYIKSSSAVCKQSSGSYPGPGAGGIIGAFQFNNDNAIINIKNCYVNDVEVNFYNSADGTYYRQNSKSGGLIGNFYTTWGPDKFTLNMSNCYCVGDAKTGKSVVAYGYRPVHDTKPNYKYNITNCFYLDSNDATTWTNQGTGEGGLTLTAATLGSAYMEDVLGVNGGLPVFSGEYEYITNTVAACENGSIDVTEKAGEVKKNGNTVYIKKNSALTVTAAPKDEGYVLESVTYGGNDKTASFVSGSATFAYSDLADNAQWSATFKTVPVDPAVKVQNEVVKGTRGDYKTAAVYAKIVGVAAPYEYGMIIKRVSDGKTLVLPAEKNENGAFAICVYGEGVKTGTFTMQPYMKVSEGGETVTGEETSAFSLEQ